MDEKLTINRNGKIYSIGDRKSKIVILDIFKTAANKFKHLRCKCDCGTEFIMHEFMLNEYGRSQCTSCRKSQTKYSKTVKKPQSDIRDVFRDEFE